MIITTYGNLTYDKNSAKHLACIISIIILLHRRCYRVTNTVAQRK